MADNGIWFKLYCSSDDDPDLDNLNIADFGRWAKLGIQMKRHGTDGIITIKPPAKTICAKFQVADFDELMGVFLRFPHVDVRSEKDSVSNETFAVVSFRNWQKYQGDYSTERVRKFRANETAKKRRDEKRRDEKRRDTVEPPSGGLSVRDLVDSWNDGFKGLLAAVEWPLAESRHRKVLLRLREHPAIDYWQQVFQNIADSSFLLGKTGTWRCSFDFIIANDNNCNKIFEGQYSNGKQTVGAARR